MKSNDGGFCMFFSDLFFIIFTIIGGLALFIFGMSVMTGGLRNAIGVKLQRLLSKATKNKLGGLALGTSLGTIIHSGPATLMLVGFVNAGLLTLEQSIAPILGANIGTTLSMQAVSFRISDYAFVAIAMGLIISLTVSNDKVKNMGRALLGFGLLFLGLETMIGAIKPHRDFLSIYLQGINGVTFGGILAGVLVSAVLTALWQSSSATIAITFAMITAGVFSEFHQVFPIVLGAHIGTSTNAILGSLGTNIEARRCAMSHFFFNVFNVALAILARPLFFRWIPMTSSDLMRQTANLHTGVMILAVVLMLPFTQPFARSIRFIVSRKKPIPEPSFLDYQLLEYPERGIVAVISELQRVLKVCVQSLQLSTRVIIYNNERETISKIKTNEKVINDIKVAMREYQLSMTKKYLSRRQIIMSHHLNRCMSGVERIGDHIEQLCDLSVHRPEKSLDKESIDSLFELYGKSKELLEMVIDSMNPEQKDFQSCAMAILDARDRYIQSSIETKEQFIKKVEKHEISSAAALYFKEYVSVMDRMNRHIKSIALAQKHEDFWIKHSKLNKKPKQLDRNTSYSVDPNDYLEKLHIEDYL
jgi:phosphate:Na+ symporter